jgi:DNA-directed RNA polymerase subunit RPC12/RpoP
MEYFCPRCGKQAVDTTINGTTYVLCPDRCISNEILEVEEMLKIMTGSGKPSMLVDSSNSEEDA